MRFATLKYMVVSPEPEELATKLIHSLKNSSRVDFKAVFVEDPTESAEPELFSVKVKSAHVANDFLMFDVSNSDKRWFRLTTNQKDPILFELIP